MAQPISDNVTRYEDYIMNETQPLGLDYRIIEAIMMQESGGFSESPIVHGDVMQASEGAGHTITSWQESIKAGVKEFFRDYKLSNNNLSESLAMYNMGPGILNYFETHGGYSVQNMYNFSASHGGHWDQNHNWTGYGDPLYVEHVLHYYGGASMNVNGAGATAEDNTASFESLHKHIYDLVVTMDKKLTIENKDDQGNDLGFLDYTKTNIGAFGFRFMLFMVGLLIFIFGLVALVGAGKIAAMASVAE